MTRKYDNYRSQTHPVHLAESQNLKYQWRGNTTIIDRRPNLSTLRNHRISNTNAEEMPQYQIADPSCPPCGITESQIPRKRKCHNYRSQTHPLHHEESQNLKYQWRGHATITDHRHIPYIKSNHIISNTNDEVMPQLQITDTSRTPWWTKESQIPMTRKCHYTRSQTHPVLHEEPHNLKYQRRGNATITDHSHTKYTMRNHRISNTNDEKIRQLQITDTSSTPWGTTSWGTTESQIPMTR